MSEMKELADRIAAEKRYWLPIAGCVVNMTFTLGEVDALSAALRAQSDAQTLAHNARREAIEEAAKFVEQHQETIRETSNGSERYLSPRKVGNLMGVAYVDGLRALLEANHE
jgi:hypothetical protein